MPGGSGTRRAWGSGPAADCLRNSRISRKFQRFMPIHPVEGGNDMQIRMLCTDCGTTEHPITVLAGSDRLEMLGWLCLVIPGWLYCALRHLLRSRTTEDLKSPQVLAQGCKEADGYCKSSARS